MQYILLTFGLLFSLTGCKGDSNPKETPTAASEECKALEMIYIAYNTFYTCIENLSEVEYTVDDTTNPESLISAEDAEREFEKKETACFNDFKKSYDTVPIKIIEQMSYFHYFYGLFNAKGHLTLKLQDPSIPKPKAGQTKEHGLKVREALKPYPIHLCMYKKMEPVYEELTPMSDEENAETPSSEEELEAFLGQSLLSLKQCMKEELGDKEYQESKKKFKCQ